MRNTIILIFTLLFLGLYSMFFVVKEGQKGIVLRFGKVIRDDEKNTIIYNPGLHIKYPMIDTVKNLDARIQTMENQADRFVTLEKKDLIIDSYIKWRISDFSRYYLATGGGDISQAEILLKRKFSDRLRSELGKLDVKSIVTDFRNKLMADIRESLNYGTSENYTREHFNTENNLNSMAVLGIQVIDVRIKQINLPTEVSDAIYQRMRAEREAVARYHRSQGQEEAEKLRALADYEVTRILAEAEHQSLIIKGDADAETAKLYANAFSDYPEFYSFIRRLRAYENSFNKREDIMILKLNNNFLPFMNIKQDY
ncbi:protease modulator HflC [Candidatus Schneideria nysicola]|uniref:protease modulator HflC n=1 Tax=Candidatus Schneideria nysicola TaxID=1081631 RepID=UPI001CAA7B68|nr:protease modulator HflC [Candidatus Schneideria nysicola]UAJ65042.1 protease modulator HflC [Candidatus Schneideria nysicola]